VTIIDNILVQIEGHDDTTFSFTELNKLNIYMANIFGIYLDTNIYNIQLYTDDSISVLGKDFETVALYIKHFDNINNDDTAYIIKKGGEQYKDSFTNFTKELVIAWFEDNFKV
jgi:hypothetical protein